MTEPELLEFTRAYYRRPAPEQVPGALATFAASSWVTDPSSRTPMLYFFVRLGRRHGSLTPEFEAVLEQASPEGRAFVQEVLELIQAPSVPDAFNRPSGTATDNDLLWMEFSLTGAAEPVVHLIDVLEWPDRVRTRLQVWLDARPRWIPRGLHAWRCRRVVTRLAELLRVDDLDHGAAEATEDLDCRSMLEDWSFSPRRFERVRRALPVALPDDDVSHIGIKATAKWSLWSQVRQDSRVFEICEIEASRRRGRAQRALVEILRTVA